MSNKKRQRTCDQNCRRFFNWFSQIYLLRSLTALIFGAIFDRYLIQPAAINTGVSYFLYIIMCFCSPTFHFLLNRYKSKSIHNHMEDLYYTAPEYHFYCNSYHYKNISSYN